MECIASNILPPFREYGKTNEHEQAMHFELLIVMRNNRISTMCAGCGARAQKHVNRLTLRHSMATCTARLRPSTSICHWPGRQ